MNQLTETELFEEPAPRVMAGTMNELAKPLPPESRAALALKSTQTEIDLRALAVKNVSIVKVVDKAGREQAHGAAMEIKRARVAIEKTGKEARDDATKFSKAVIAEEKRLIAIIEAEEARLIGLRDAWDDEQARIKAEAEVKEQARISAIHARIAEIRNFSTQAALCRTASSIAESLDKLQKFELGGFDEFAEEANAVHAATVSGVQFLLAEKQKEEAEHARIKAKQEAEQAALQRAKAEQEAERLRIKAEQDAAAAALKQAQDKAHAEQAAAAEKLAAERKALEKERAELAAAKAAALQAIEDVKPKATSPEQVDIQASTPSFVETDPRHVMVSIPVPAVETRPTDMAIISALAGYFSAPRTTVIQWLRGMDLGALEVGAP